MATSAVFSLPALHELNRRCIDHLAHAARRRAEDPLSLICAVRQELLATTPGSRTLASARAFLLLDLEFRNAPWWQTIAHHPERQIRKPALDPAFPRYAALPLTRATLITAWRSVCADPRSARILMGLHEAVAEIFVTLPVTAIDAIAHHMHSHLRPRWAHNPALWRAILQAANREDTAALSLLDIEGIQLLASEMLIANSKSAVRHQDQHRGSPLPHRLTESLANRARRRTHGAPHPPFMVGCHTGEPALCPGRTP